MSRYLWNKYNLNKPQNLINDSDINQTMLITELSQVGLIVYKLCNLNDNEIDQEQNLLNQNFKSKNEVNREKMNQERQKTFGAKEIKKNKKIIIDEQVKIRRDKNNEKKKKNKKK